MGLYVVARLAKRHDIKVRLRGNEDIEGGMTALVVVPGSLVLGPGAEVNTPPSGAERPAVQAGGGIASAFGMPGAPPPRWRSSRFAVAGAGGRPGMPVQFSCPARQPGAGRHRRTALVAGLAEHATARVPAQTPQESTASWIPSMEDSAAGQPVDMFAGFQELPRSRSPRASALAPASTATAVAASTATAAERPRRAAGRRPAGPRADAGPAGAQSLPVA